VLHDSAVAVDIVLEDHHRTLCNVSATARELFVLLVSELFVFSAFFATRSEHTSMTAPTISTCFSYLHLHSRSASGERPRLVRLAKPLACSSWHHAFTILQWVISTSGLWVIYCICSTCIFSRLCVLDTTGFIISVRFSHLCLRRIFGFITVRSSRLWLHHDSSDIINITLRSAQLYRRPSFHVGVVQRGDAR
jgi:hypothetical protein